MFPFISTTGNMVDSPSTPYQPTFRDMIQLDLPTGVRIAPGGGRVASTIRTTSWKDDCYESRVHVHDVANGTMWPLHRSGNALQVEWVNDHTLAVLKRSSGDDSKAQVWFCLRHWERLLPAAGRVISTASIFPEFWEKEVGRQTPRCMTEPRMSPEMHMST